MRTRRTAVRVERDDTILQARDPLTACYDPATVSINANTVHATHGATVANEVLGSGDTGKLQPAVLARGSRR